MCMNTKMQCLEDTAAYYSRKTSSLIVEDSYPDYMLKKLKNELSVLYSNQLLEKEFSGFRALIRDDKVVLNRVLLKMSMNEPKSVDFEEGWGFVQQRINRLKRIVEEQKTPFSAEENMMLYTNIYNMCRHKSISYAPQIFAKYKETLDEYINSTVLPALQEKDDGELMLRELVKRWSNYKRMVKLLIHFFHYLESSYDLGSSPKLNDVGLVRFHDLVYQELHGKAISTVIALIEKEREGEQIDRALLKNVCEIFVELGRGNLEYYVCDFEDAMLRDTSAYYSRKASTWITEYSYPNYMLKVEECLKNEKDRVSHYLHDSSEIKLLKKVKNELLVAYTDQLVEKERSGPPALLRDDKKVKNEMLVAYTDQLLEKESSGSRALLSDDKAESSGSSAIIP